MKVRRGNQNDMRAIIDFLEKYHAKSNFADIPFERLTTTKLMEYYLSGRDTVTYVAEDLGGNITGLLAGGLEPLPFNITKMYATDLWFISEGGAGAILLKKFIRWAKDRGAVRLIMGVSSGDPSADALYEANKFERVGGMHVLR